MIECQEETEQDPVEWEQAAEWGKVGEAETPAVWVDHSQQDRQATAYVRIAGTRNRISVEFPVWIGDVLSAGLR